MTSFQPILDRAVARMGGADALEAALPRPKNAADLCAVPDDRYLSLITRRVFQAGLKHAMVDAKWPAFEDAFHGFAPRRVAAMPPEELEHLLHDRRLIRHWGKLKSVPANAAAMLEVAAGAGGFGAWLAAWPTRDIVGLWQLLRERFAQLGGNSGPYALRMMGKDTFLITEDVTKALIAAGVVARKPGGKRDLAAVQSAFNAWAEETGRPLCQLSRMLALSVG